MTRRHTEHTQGDSLTPAKAGVGADLYSSVAAFKYRHRERDGTIVDSLPALNSETRNVRLTSNSPLSFGV